MFETYNRQLNYLKTDRSCEERLADITTKSGTTGESVLY